MVTVSQGGALRSSPPPPSPLPPCRRHGRYLRLEGGEELLEAAHLACQLSRVPLLLCGAKGEDGDAFAAAAVAGVGVLVVLLVTMLE